MLMEPPRLEAGMSGEGTLVISMREALLSEMAWSDVLREKPAAPAVLTSSPSSAMLV
jgi:hypothetical protein